MIGRPVDDFYTELGVGRTATRDEIVTAFRARARELHPDTRPADAAAIERFKRVSRAYGVLRDPVRRARYDAGLPDVRVPTHANRPSPTPTPDGQRPHLSRRAAHWMAWGGGVLMLLGIAAAVWVVSLQRHDADLRARGVPAIATVVDTPGGRRLQFTTRDGRTVRTVERIKSGEQQAGLGATVPIHYDRNDPTTIVTDQSHTGRDVTLWIVAIKLLVGGAVLVVFGVRRLRRSRPT